MSASPVSEPRSCFPSLYLLKVGHALSHGGFFRLCKAKIAMQGQQGKSKILVLRLRKERRESPSNMKYQAALVTLVFRFTA